MHERTPINELWGVKTTFTNAESTKHSQWNSSQTNPEYKQIPQGVNFEASELPLWMIGQHFTRNVQT